MVISHKYKCIFIHIQKTGGSSIEKALCDNDPDVLLSIPPNEFHPEQLKGRHVFARDIRAHIGESIWQEYFKFAFVRNPWDRLVSWYNMIDQAGQTLDHGNRFFEYVQKNAQNFNDFIKKCSDVVTEDLGEQKSTAFNQLDYITDEQGNLLVDYIGRFERINQDFKNVCQKIKLNSSLEHVNKFRHKHYSKYFSKELEQIVTDRYKRDIDYFKYSFQKQNFLQQLFGK